MRQPINLRDYQGSEAIDPWEGSALNGRLGSFQLIWLKLEELRLFGLFFLHPALRFQMSTVIQVKETDEKLEEEGKRCVGGH